MKKRPGHSALMQACWDDPDWAAKRRATIRDGISGRNARLSDRDREARSLLLSLQAKARWQDPEYRALVEARKAEARLRKIPR
jgi:hypothetical protein